MAETPTMEVRARLSAETANFTRGFAQASQAVDQFSQKASPLRGVMTGIATGTAIATAAIVAFGVKSFMAAARVDELDYAINAVGKSTGLGYKVINDAAMAIRRQGIEMEIAQKSALKYAQNNLDLSKAADVARIAQDLAIISGANSTETYNMLTHAIITGRSEVLKSVGIQQSAGQMNEVFARSIGKTVTQLTYQEKQQAVLSGVIREGAKVQGTYEESMKAPGKILRSFPRVFNEIQIAMGGALLKGFGPLIFHGYELVKSFANAMRENKAFQTVIEAFGMVLTKLSAPFVVIFQKLKGFIDMYGKTTVTVGSITTVVDKAGTSVGELATKFEMIIGPLTAAAAGLSAFGGANLLQQIPVLGKFLSFLKPFPVAFFAMALTSAKVRNAIGNLLSAFKPLLPVIGQVAKVMSFLSVIATVVLAKAINIVAGVVRGIIGLFQKNAEILKVLGVLVGSVAVVFGIYRGLLIASATATAIWGAVTGAVTTVVSVLTRAMKILNLTMAFNPFLLVVAAIVALIAAFTYLMITNEDFRKVVEKVFNFVIKIVIKVFSGILTAVADLIQTFNFFVKVLGFLVEVFVAVFEGILDTVLTVFIAIIKGIKFLIDGFVSLMESNDTLRKVFENVFNGIIRIVGFVVKGILNTFGFLVGGVADLVGVFNSLFSSAKSIFFSILDVISRVGKGIFGILSFIAEKIGTFLGAVFDGITGWIRTLASLLGKIPRIGPAIEAGLNAGLDATKKAVVGIAALGVAIAETGFDNIIKGVKTTVNAVSTIGVATQKTLEKTEATLKNFSNTVGQFTDENNGAKIVDGLIKGAVTASSVLDGVKDSLESIRKIDMAGNVGKVVDGITNKIEESAQFVLGLAKTVNDFAEKDTNFAGNIISGIATIADKIKASFTEGLGFGDMLAEQKKKFDESVPDPKKFADLNKVAEDMGEQADSMKKIREAMAKGIEGIQNIITDLRDAMKDMADSLKDTIVGFAGLKGVELPDGFIPKAKSLIDNMELKLNKSLQFANQIEQLQGMNLDAGALKAIIEEGPIKGAQLAASILGGGQIAVNEVSRLQKNIESAGLQIGTFGSQVSFQPKIDAATAKLGAYTGASLIQGATGGGGNVYLQQGSVNITIDASKATTAEETAAIVERDLEKYFSALGKELAAR